MQETRERLFEKSEQVQGHMDALANLYSEANDALWRRDFSRFAIVQILLQRERAAYNIASEEVMNLMTQFREERREMFKIPRIAVLILILFLAFGLVSAQDVPLATNTAAEAVVQPVPVVATVNGVPVAATLEPVSSPPTVIAVQEPTNPNTIYVVGFLAILIFSGVLQFLSNRQIGTLADMVNKALTNKQVIDEAHRLYLESSLSVQNVITLVGGIAGFVGATIPGDDLAEQLKRFVDKTQLGEPSDTASQSGGIFTPSSNLSALKKQLDQLPPKPADA